ncbi:uncharacterized protein V6R79_006786 [Siganus canaliculatus]
MGPEIKNDFPVLSKRLKISKIPFLEFGLLVSRVIGPYMDNYPFYGERERLQQAWEFVQQGGDSDTGKAVRYGIKIPDVCDDAVPDYCCGWREEWTRWRLLALSHNGTMTYRTCVAAGGVGGAGPHWPVPRRAKSRQLLRRTCPGRGVSPGWDKASKRLERFNGGGEMELLETLLPRTTTSVQSGRLLGVELEDGRGQFVESQCSVVLEDRFESRDMEGLFMGHIQD